VASLIKEAKVKSVHDISEGGLMITLLESAFTTHKGFDVAAQDTNLRKDAYWLGEAQSRVVVSCSAENIDAIQAAATAAGIGFSVIGKVTNGDMKVSGENWGSIADWKNKYDTAIEKQLAK
jgi:phosphoribosylformylglycinamidine synthase